MRITLAFALFLCVTCSTLGAQDKPQGAPDAEKIGWRLGTQLWSFNRFTFFEAIEKTASLGLKYAEAFPGQKLSKDKPDVVFDHNIPVEIQREAMQKLKEAGVTIVNYGVVGLGANEAENRKVFDFARTMGIETICSEPAPEDLPGIAKLCEEYGINVAIHNHPLPTRYWNPDAVLAALKGIESKRVGACADTGHWLRSGINPIQAMQKLEGKIICYHFKDLNRPGLTGHDVPWGTGKGNARAMLEEIRRQNFKGVFSIEYEHKWTNSLPDIAECVAFFNQTAAELSKGETK
ncbi:MAG TPA: sugar phosphate isomerase/epimerase [Candidatus Brocadiia bacterium]|nr:sugar phosphate isomerase/epimerase [Candidatus Brocadiia bacterium]